MTIAVYCNNKIKHDQLIIMTTKQYLFPKIDECFPVNGLKIAWVFLSKLCTYMYMREENQQKSSAVSVLRPIQVFALFEGSMTYFNILVLKMDNYVCLCWTLQILNASIGEK